MINLQLHAFCSYHRKYPYVCVRKRFVKLISTGISSSSERQDIIY